ncbi:MULTISPECIES: TetR/AcrR family transcriptional regulator [Bacillaceae]|uniref:TetR/AcrR family transcriptional regulator n=1 Tax=Bacillaceae TaxID=186817 RepID=UPI001E3B29DF|nr:MULTISPECIES: TetR/AcrR family transcriptional regulator [Bacillaceae]MCE4051657.1 TetR/AcrR family transcriptional regulator; helix-turn-helix transcriptional regulator [Bacillus sp. Au-Bac7]MCM3029625.1 TetR/AcrR family transcriptional regulator [Niallia sp. MER 6]MDL0437047.1 helix-turn-helix domain-containing protein [Niallia sp. SS-2023]UPO87158.1 TetR/AcrR family transcriptional regulator [Niallia sp. Man26]
MKRDHEELQSQTMDTHHLIIKAATTLFMELGYRAVSTRKIAAACGITQPALYHHFQNKQEIYIEVLKASILQTENYLYKIAADYPDIKQRIFHLASYFMQNYEEDLMQMFHDLHHEMPEDVKKTINSHWQKGFLAPIMRMFEEAVANKEIGSFEKIDSSSFEVSLLLLNMIKSALLPEYMKRLSETEQKAIIDKKAKLIVQIFLSGIA